MPGIMEKFGFGKKPDGTPPAGGIDTAPNTTVQKEPGAEPQKPEVDSAQEFDISTIKLTDPNIIGVVSQLAKQAEQMLKGGESGPSVNAKEITDAIKVLAQLDAAMNREKEALLDESPLKKLTQIADQMNEKNRAMVLQIIDEMKQNTFNSIEKSHKESQITDAPLDLDAALQKRLDSTKVPYDSMGSRLTHFDSLDELNDFLTKIIGADYQVIKNNPEIWKKGTPSLDSKKVPGLNISIYDRVAQGISKDGSGNEFNVDMSISINSMNEPRPLKAAILDSFEDKKPKE